MSFTFEPQFIGGCPECPAFGRLWYIQDRFIGENQYEYCLKSVSATPQVTYKFDNLKKVAEWICNLKNLSRETEYFIKNWYLKRYIQFETNDAALLKKDGIEYRLDKHTFTVTQLHERIEETGWFSSYRECLNAAKEILEKLEIQHHGEQLSL